jgi:hypothetical protein
MLMMGKKLEGWVMIGFRENAYVNKQTIQHVFLTCIINVCKT